MADQLEHFIAVAICLTVRLAVIRVLSKRLNGLSNFGTESSASDTLCCKGVQVSQNNFTLNSGVCCFLAFSSHHTDHSRGCSATLARYTHGRPQAGQEGALACPSLENVSLHIQYFGSHKNEPKSLPPHTFHRLKNGCKGKGKGSGLIQHLYFCTSYSRRSGTDHTVLPANYTVPASTS